MESWRPTWLPPFEMLVVKVSQQLVESTVHIQVTEQNPRVSEAFWWSIQDIDVELVHCQFISCRKVVKLCELAFRRECFIGCTRAAMCIWAVLPLLEAGSCCFGAIARAASGHLIQDDETDWWCFDVAWIEIAVCGECEGVCVCLGVRVSATLGEMSQLCVFQWWCWILTYCLKDICVTPHSKLSKLFQRKIKSQEQVKTETNQNWVCKLLTMTMAYPASQKMCMLLVRQGRSYCFSTAPLHLHYSCILQFGSSWWGPVLSFFLLLFARQNLQNFYLAFRWKLRYGEI